MLIGIGIVSLLLILGMGFGEQGIKTGPLGFKPYIIIFMLAFAGIFKLGPGPESTAVVGFVVILFLIMGVYEFFAGRFMK